jgi:hypothetical protein
VCKMLVVAYVFGKILDERADLELGSWDMCAVGDDQNISYQKKTTFFYVKAKHNDGTCSKYGTGNYCRSSKDWKNFFSSNNLCQFGKA